MSPAEDPRISAALQTYARYQEELLAKGPLGGIAEWVRTGVAPAAATLRAEGLRSGADEPALRAHELAMARKAFTRSWGYSIPCAEAVEALRALGPIVEVGAGSGYWAALLRAAGVDVVATDLNPRGRHAYYGFENGAHLDIEALDAASAVRKYSDRAVFCSWPSETNSWGLGAAWALRSAQRLAVILNPGNTGTPGLVRYLRTRFRKVADVEIPQFPTTADVLTIFEKA